MRPEAPSRGAATSLTRSTPPRHQSMGSAVFPGSPSAPGPGQELRPETMHHTHHTSLISGPVGTGLEPQTRKARVLGLFEAAEGTRSLDLLLANGLADPRDVDRVMSTFRLEMSDISGPGDASKRRLDARRSGTFGAVFPEPIPEPCRLAQGIRESLDLHHH